MKKNLKPWAGVNAGLLKMIRIMRITIFIVFVSLSQALAVSSYSQQTKLSLDLEDARVEEVIDQIEKSTEFVFLYNRDVIDVERRLNIQVKKGNISEVLDQIFGNTDVSYSIKDRKIFLINNQLHSSDSQSSMQQEFVVSGRVTDSSGSPLPGVTIVIKNSNGGVITDIDGKYTIRGVSSNATLVFSFVGMKPVEVPVAGQSVIDVMMSDAVVGLEEVIAIGYGTQKKRDLTGSIASVGSEKIMATAPTTIQEALRGKAAGVMVAGAGLNSDPMIRIRGNRSISASNDPLFVIDGIPAADSIITVSPFDVSSVEVLKDASATAIYGARGANGVILITTKKGQEGKVTVEYNGYLSIGKIDQYRRVRNPEEYLEYLREGHRKYSYDGVGGYQIDPGSTYTTETPNKTDDMIMEYVNKDPSGYVKESVLRAWDGGTFSPSMLRGFDWQMAGFRDQAISHNHNVSIRGGSKDTKVFVSGSFMDNEGITPRSYRTRYTLRMNLDQNLGKIITMGATTNFAYWEYYNGTGVGGNWNPLGTPYYTPGGSGDYGIGGDVTKDGDPALGLVPHPCGEGMLWNPFYDFTGNQGQTKRNQIDATIYGQINLPFGLSYRVNFGTNYYSGQNQFFYASASSQRGFGDAQANQELEFDRGWTLEHILGYAKTFGEHSLNLTAVQSSQKYVSEPVTAAGIDLPLESQLYYSLGTASTQSATSGYTQWTMASYMGRAIYGFKDNRYMLTASLRYDGASRLSEGHKWVAFPSLALAWRVSDEAFLKDNAIVSNLKLRLGYGKTGNSAVNAYQTIGKIASSRYTFGNVGVVGYAPSSLSNSDLSWETTDQYNIGVDYGFLKGRISGSVDLYRQNTHDLLMPRVLPEVSGFGSIVENVGETRNEGLEVTFESVNVNTRAFRWSTSLQFSTNKEQVVSLASGLDEDLANMWFVDHPIDTYYDYVNTKYVWGYSKEDMEEMAKFNANGHDYEPGDLRFLDLDENYKIDEEDRTFRGQKMPKWNLGMGNTFNYKNFDLYVFTYGMFGHTIYCDPGVGHDGRMNTRYAEYWTPRNQESRFRKPLNGDADQTHREAYWYSKGNFVRISDMTLGYSLPSELIRHVCLQKARFYVQLQNPFTFTNYPNNDPEGSVKGTRNYANKHNAYSEPTTMKYYIFGVNLTF